MLKKIPSLNIFPAIDGKTNELEYNLENRKIDEKFLKFCRRGQVACLLSHLNLWKKIVEENIENAIILEDDVKLDIDITNVNIPKDADFAYLYVHPDCIKKEIDCVNTNENVFEKGYFTYGLVCYYITKKLAEELISFFKYKITTTVDDTVSWYLDNYNKKYYCANLVYTVGSLYFHKQSGIGSTIGNTTLYKDNSGIPSFYIDKEDYLYYPCCNCDDNLYFSNNLKNVEKYSGYSINEKGGWIKKSCDNIYIDVNSYLYVKKKKSGTPAILLTGGCGYIGSHTALELIKEYPNHELAILDNLTNSDINVIDKLKLFTDKLFFYNLDITENIDKVFEYHDIKSVIHFAALKSVSESIDKPLKYYNNNISGLINLLKTMQKYKVENLIFSSSATVYGNPEALPLTEESSTSAINPYGKTKLFAEEILKDLKDMNIICLRYFNPVGASKTGLIKENPKGVPNNLFPFIISVIKGKRDKLYIFGNDYPTKDGTAIRDYIHIEDLAKGHISALKYLKNKENIFDIFNLGTGKGHSVLEIVKAFEKEIGKEISYEFAEKRKGDSCEVYANCDKAEKMLNWKAELHLEDMIKNSL